MVGLEVTKTTLDFKMAEAILALRKAFDKVEVIAGWLADHPAPGADPLTTDPNFGYNVDEAYVIRLVFETFENIRVNNQSTFNTARKLTGLD